MLESERLIAIVEDAIPELRKAAEAGKIHLLIQLAIYIAVLATGTDEDIVLELLGRGPRAPLYGLLEWYTYTESVEVPDANAL